ncbi:Hyalin [Holothuria leucospilota]|uniref:Hyalin n=1 Tax=Holothuria leucospilota TaxID=206669 RepID=A0A9Q1BXE7_HOLLE|nr:Hyalin [Holothuria leucospilota]
MFDAAATGTNTPPSTPSCPTTTVTVNAAAGATAAVVNYGSVTCTDNQGVITASCTRPSGGTFTIGTTSVSCTCTDNGGLTSTCSFNVFVQDTNTPPSTPSCPTTAVTVNAAAGATTAVVNYGSVTCTDNQGVITASCTRPSSGTFTIGTTGVSCTCTDNGGLTSTCSFNVVVQATGTNTPPSTPSCPTTTVTVNAAAGATTAVVNYGSVTCTDNQGVITASCNRPSGGTFTIGTTGVSCTCTDNGGLTSTCSFNVVVQAGGVSAATCPGTVTVTPNNNGQSTLTFTPVQCPTGETGSCDPMNGAVQQGSGPFDVCCTCSSNTAVNSRCCFPRK